MIESKTLAEIKKCQKCNLYQNQTPLLDLSTNNDIMFVGLSAKIVKTPNDKPLDENTNTGKIIKQIEDSLEGIKIYRTNIVKCVPLNDSKKLRYPTKKEINSCLKNLDDEIEYTKSKIIFLLGNEVAKSVLSIHVKSYQKYTPIIIEKKVFIAIEHPSYIYIYKKKFIYEYIDKIKKLIKENYNT